MAEKVKKIKVDLEYPIEKDNGVTISSVNIYRLKVKHLKTIPDELFSTLAAGGEGQISPKHLIPLITSCSSLTEEDMDELDAHDLQKIAEAMNESNFL